LASKVNVDARFKQVHQSVYDGYKYLRIKAPEQIFECKAEKFSKVFIISSLSNDLSFILLIPSQPFEDKDMHENIK
jgi:hypothetical protein